MFATLLAFFPHGAAAQDDGLPPVIAARRADPAPVIDGRLEDEAWAKAPVATDFVDIRLNAPAEDQTFVRLLYDDEFIYVAFECLEDPSTIIATQRKEDRRNLRREDYVQVAFDTFHDHKQAYMFLTSPLGTRWDARDGVFGFNPSWDADWRVATTIQEDRWVAELAIPIGAMYFDRDDDMTWGVNFRRSDRGSNSTSMWSYHIESGVPLFGFGPKAVADFGNLEGLDLSNMKIDRRPQLELQSTLTAIRRKGGAVHTQVSGGADLSLRLSPHWVATFTANPNFSEVDADEGDVQLRDTQRFLAENRTFFNEGAELFRTPVNIYDTRNITDIDTAAKITGTGRDWTLAALGLDGASSRSGVGKLLAVHYTRNLGDRAQLGGMLVGVDGHKNYNVVAGVDARVDIMSTTTWTSQFLYMQDKKRVVSTYYDPNGYELEFAESVHKSGHGFVTMLDGGKKPFFWQLAFEDISADFEPDLSFIPRRDIIGPTLMLTYSQDVSEGPVERYGADFIFQYYQNHAGSTTLRDFFFWGGIDLANNLDFRLFRAEDFHKPYDNVKNQLEVRYNRQDYFRSVEVEFSWGKFSGVPFEEVEIEKPFQIGNRFTSELSGTFRRESPRYEADRDVWLWRAESEYTFTWDGRIKLTLEQSSTDAYNRTILFAYEDVRDWDFFLVLSDVRGEEGPAVQRLFTKFVYRF